MKSFMRMAACSVVAAVWALAAVPKAGSAIPAGPPTDAILLAATQAKPGPEVEALYPGLTSAAQRWAQDWRAYLSTSRPVPVESNMELVSIVWPKEQAELAKYLNYWNRTRNSLRTTGLHFVHDAFDGVGSDPPEKQAYVVFQDRGRYFVLRFQQRPPTKAATRIAATRPGAAAQGRWDDGDIASLVGAARLGAAVAAVQETLDAVREGKALNESSSGGELAWNWPKPAEWVFFEQKYDKGGLGFFAMEDAMADDAKTTTRVGLLCRDEAKKEFGLNVSLVRKAGAQGYLGWRIDKIEAADKPQAEPAK